MDEKQKTVGEVEGFIDMLRAACEDKNIYATLENLLSHPDEKRKEIVRLLLEDLKSKKVPSDLIEAISCLQDNAVAEKAYEVIYQCRH